MIFGIDEVGRGCWAGPLVVCAVGLEKPIDGLRDSKKLSSLQRLKIMTRITTDYNNILIASVSSAEVDKLGLTKAMYKACDSLFSSISKLPYDKIVVDGNINYLPDVPRSEALIGADGLVAECMAASVAAKEWRDEYMRKVADSHPGYGFESHVGYGTKQHKDAIAKLGLTPEHRRSFKPIKSYEAGAWTPS